MVLSILLAFLLWVYVGNDPNSVDTGTLRNVRVVFSGLEKLEERGLMISEGAEQTVNLQLSARGEVWSRLNQGDTTVVVDVSGITEPGEQSVAITSRNINFPRSITIIDSIDVRYTSPSTIDFTVSRWSSKEIPVQGTFNGIVNLVFCTLRIAQFASISIALVRSVGKSILGFKSLGHLLITPVIIPV